MISFKLKTHFKNIKIIQTKMNYFFMLTYYALITFKKFRI